MSDFKVGGSLNSTLLFPSNFGMDISLTSEFTHSTFFVNYEADKVTIKSK